MSDFEELSDENTYDTDSESDSLEELVDQFKCLKPYQFEPEKEVVSETDESGEDSEESDGESQNLATNERVGNTAWCECSQCKVENREIDCLCCQEVAALNERFDKLAVNCITEDEELRTLCLNKAVLENVLTGLHDSKGDHLEKDITNRSYRYAAYRQFTWWVYKHLGKGNRRVIPSCTLWVIRNAFPESDGQYVLYNEGDKD